MTLMYNVGALHDLLFELGFEIKYEIFPFRKMATTKNIKDCLIISKKREFEIIYMETYSKPANEGTIVAEINVTPCLIISATDKQYKITVVDYESVKNASFTITKEKSYLKPILEFLSDCNGDFWEINSTLVKFLNSMESFKLPD